MTINPGPPIIPGRVPATTAPVADAASAAPDTDTSAPPSRPRGLVPLVVALAVLLVAAVAVAGWALSRGASSPPPVTSSASPAAVSAHGSLVLEDSRGVLNIDDYHCEGMGGYSDIRPGASVTVTDASGATIGLGSLSQGTMVGAGATRTCSFTFGADVPAGKGFYGIEVAHRGRVSFPEADLRGSVQLTIG